MRRRDVIAAFVGLAVGPVLGFWLGVYGGVAFMLWLAPAHWHMDTPPDVAYFSGAFAGLIGGPILAVVATRAWSRRRSRRLP